MKICKKCDLQKNESEFPAEKRNKDGLNGTCRICCNARARMWYAENPDLVKQGYERNKENKLANKALYYKNNEEAIRGKVADYRKLNPEQQKQYFREYRISNPEKVSEQGKKWRLLNPGRRTAHDQNRRARKKKNGGKLSSDIVKRLTTLQKGRCAACRCKLSESGVHLDHVIPLSGGGENSDSNVQLLCPTCNAQKHCSHPVDFMRRKGFLL